jgi:hypothetical protein
MGSVSSDATYMTSFTRLFLPGSDLTVKVALKDRSETSEWQYGKVKLHTESEGNQ